MKKDRIPYEGTIGVVVESFDTLGGPYNKGDFVLFEDQGGGKVTVETPLTKHEIEDRRKEGSLISTILTIVNVPRNFVEEVKLY
ncbi:MAG: hypothetical protein ABH804_00590 [archaeon]